MTTQPKTDVQFDRAPAVLLQLVQETDVGSVQDH